MDGYDGFHETLDKQVMQDVEALALLYHEKCPSIGSKLLTINQGNHTWVFEDGTTADERLARLLGVRYSGLMSYTQLRVYRSNGREKMGTGHNLNVLTTHSSSSSGTLTSSLAAAERQAEGHSDWDVFVSGNDHQLGVMNRQKLGATQRGVIRQVERHYIIGKAGSFQLGYIPGPCKKSYIEKRGLKPSMRGWLCFDCWIYHAATPKDSDLTNSPEVWRFGSFNV